MKYLEASSSFLPLLIGNGRLARHLGHYLELRKIPFLRWNEPRSPVPRDLIAHATHLWVLVSDQALPEICMSLHSDDPHLPILHSSAASAIPFGITVHPLMTFSSGEFYPQEDYERFPFTLIREEIASHPEILDFLGTNLPNPIQLIPASARTRYHASAVMISNFSVLLWKAGLKALALDLSLPREAYVPILERTLTNFTTSGAASLTGPLVRGDRSVTEAHLESLSGTPEADLYRAFRDYFHSNEKERP